MPHGWSYSQLKSGRAVVLVDGVDELPEARRQEAYQWLEELVTTFPQARFIVTSRPHAVEEEWLTHQGFDYAELQPMELAAIDEFIDHWHRAVHEELFEPEGKAELENLPASLKAAIRRNRAIRNLATNPLLCAMLCALHRDRRRQLPSDRIELYQAGCAMLLERRDIERRVELRDYPPLTYRQKLPLLQDLAYWMLTNGWPEVPRRRAEDRLSRRLANMEGIPKGIDGTQVCRFFVERSGIIREPVAGKIDFTHRTFQEFLAAQAALDEDDVGVLVRNANDDQWREVVILAAGLARPKESGELIDMLIARGDKENEYRHRLHLLAIACLETAIELDPQVRTKVQERMAQVLPPNSMEEAQALASAGELAVPHLVSRPQYREPTAAACVRTLTLIGGEVSLPPLETYAEDTRAQVLGELWRGWDSFDREEYARCVLYPIVARDSHVTLRRVSSLEGCQCLTNMAVLHIDDCQQINDLSPLSGLTDLRGLFLVGCTQLSDLRPLANLTDLGFKKE
jgi:hypothetical protein